MKKEKKISCGILILNEYDELLVGHVTGQKHVDIPKGQMEEGESPLNCAIRECKEETGLLFDTKLLVELGRFSYTREKDLHLFATRVAKSSINLQDLCCTTFFENPYTQKLQPEISGFEWLDYRSVTGRCAKSMGALLSSIKL